MLKTLAYYRTRILSISATPLELNPTLKMVTPIKLMCHFRITVWNFIVYCFYWHNNSVNPHECLSFWIVMSVDIDTRVVPDIPLKTDAEKTSEAADQNIRLYPVTSLSANHIQHD